jgi:hypothetical protein
MKTRIHTLLFLTLLSLFTTCDPETIVPLTMSDFKFEVKYNTNLDEDYISYFSKNKDTIYVVIPHFQEVNQLAASFKLHDGAIATIDGKQQESGITSNDFTIDLAYTISAGQGSENIIIVHCINELSFSVNGFSNDSTRIGAGDFIKEELFEISNITNGTYICEFRIKDNTFDSTIIVKENSFMLPNILSVPQWIETNNGMDGELVLSLQISSQPLGISDRSYSFTVNREQYKIKTWQDLQAMKYDLLGDYKIYSDIQFPYPGVDNFPREGFSPIGDSLERSFKGSLDGQHHVVSNFYIYRVDGKARYIGLFGATELRADKLPIIKNIGLELAERYESGGITGGLCTGGIVGYNEGKIINCYVKGNIVGVGIDREPGATGGLIGVNKGGEIIGCYSTGGQVESYLRAGGLIGQSIAASHISKCYSNQEVIITSDGEYETKDLAVGGLIGYHAMNSHIENCYSTGDVKGSSCAGGLVGVKSPNSTITMSYCTGNVIETDGSGSEDIGGFIGRILGTKDLRMIHDCYWNNAANPNLISIGIGSPFGTDGRSEREFKNQEMFVGWDFDNTWIIKPNINNGWPHLVNINTSN